jgi:hypothetical protein
MKTVQEICKETLGYAEGPNNDTKFGKWYGLNHQPWCAMSASKIFFDAGRILEVAPEVKSKGYASCDEWLKYLTKNNQLVPIGQAKQDDLIFFQYDADAMPDHVGIVKGHNIDKKIVYYYSGNTSSGTKGSQSNGGGFYLKKCDYSLIMAVARPKEMK